MPDGWEVTHGLAPLTANGFEDADGDRYPNVFEHAYSTDPSDSSSKPTPTFVVNGAGGGTHTTISAAISAANVVNGAYQIIAIAPGTYTGSANVSGVTLASNKPKFLVIGSGGAGTTIIDGAGVGTWGWNVYNAAVVSSLTFRNTWLALYVNAPAAEVRVVDVLVKDNATTSSYASGVHVNSAAKTYVVGSTFLNNTGSTSYANQIYIGAGAGSIANTVVWGSASGTMLAKAGSATLTTNYSLAKGQTLTGTGNLAGTTDPKLRADAHLRSDSPLRSAGGTVAQSRLDLDGELRPSSTPDIGVDQFLDSDADGLADSWEVERTGGLTALTGQSQDADGDGLTNEQEYVASTDPTVSDTDGDGVSDGSEATYGTDPLKTDTDGDDMPDGWELTHGLAPLTANGFEDADGDRYPNVFEYAYSTDPSDAQSKPTPTFVVDGAGSGTHTTVGDAVSAANVASGAYQIIGIAPGVYTGQSNLNGVDLASNKPKFLLIGLEGAGKTIFDGEGARFGWDIYNSAVIASLTFRNTSLALFVSAASSEVRFVDLLVRDNATTTWASGVHVAAAAKTHVVGSTFVDNAGSTSYANQIYIGAGAATILNTVVWGSASGTMLGKAGSATLTTNHSLAKGQTLSGTGNLAGTTNPKLRSDGRLLWDSPLRAAGGSVTQSRIDVDGELRPSSAPDIGMDQFVDSDADQLADKWELDRTGGLTTLTSRAQDADGDGLTNEQEYVGNTYPSVADTDGDGLSDGDEVSVHTSDPLKTDTDGDDMPDGWEVTHGFSPLTANGFEDADGDRYPNVFEYARSTDPTDAQSTPTANFVVDGAGGGTHTTVSAAIGAANVANGAYQIIGIAPGVYTGQSNLNGVDLASNKPKFLLIGLEGAEKTIFDGEGARFGWDIYNSAVVASLTFRNTWLALFVSAASSEVRFVDLLVRDNATTGYASGVHVVSAVKTYVAGSTFLNNTGDTSLANQIYIGSGSATVVNTVMWGDASGTTLGKATTATLSTNYSLAKGQTLSGTGNLPGTTDPKLRAGARLRSDSPLRGAGGAFVQSRMDIDGELRPTTTPDIGVDQFGDSDADGLADWWENERTGGLSTLTSSTQDSDADGATNDAEYTADTDPLVADTDGDDVPDGVEIAGGTNPLVRDAEDFVVDWNGDGVIDSIGLQLGYGVLQSDSDGDGVSNEDELLMCMDPTRPDSDGDGVSDDVDVFARDPLMSSLPSDSQDVTAPVITLVTPWYAVEQ